MFVPNTKGVVPMYEGHEKLHEDSHLVFEYFDGDTGKGLGANHQTGWTGLIAEIIRQLHTKS
jgi:hypothetical protein